MMTFDQVRLIEQSILLYKIPDQDPILISQLSILHLSTNAGSKPHEQSNQSAVNGSGSILLLFGSQTL